MEQLTYTWCRAGRSVSGRGGQGVRAASEGARPVLDQAAVLVKGQPPPEDCPTTGPEPAARLVWLPGGTQPRLMHTAPNDRATETRDGAFFAHVLLQPGSFDTHRAAAAYGADGWQRHDVEGSIKLPPPQSPAFINPTFRDGELTRRLADPGEQARLRWLIQRWLTTPRPRLVLAEPPADVAWAVWSLTRLLPRPLWDTLSFSTYEKQPSTAAFDVIGGWTAAESLPTPQREDMLLYNPHAAAAETLDPASPGRLGAWLIDNAADGRWHDIDGLRHLAEQLTVETASGLCLLHRIEHESAPLPVAAVPQVLAHAGVARRWLQDGAAATLLIAAGDAAGLPPEQGLPLAEHAAATHRPEAARALVFAGARREADASGWIKHLLSYASPQLQADTIPPLLAFDSPVRGAAREATLAVAEHWGQAPPDSLPDEVLAAVLEAAVAEPWPLPPPARVHFVREVTRRLNHDAFEREEALAVVWQAIQEPRVDDASLDRLADCISLLSLEHQPLAQHLLPALRARLRQANAAETANRLAAVFARLGGLWPDPGAGAMWAAFWHGAINRTGEPTLEAARIAVALGVDPEAAAVLGDRDNEAAQLSEAAASAGHLHTINQLDRLAESWPEEPRRRWRLIRRHARIEGPPALLPPVPTSSVTGRVASWFGRSSR